MKDTKYQNWRPWIWLLKWLPHLTATGEKPLKCTMHWEYNCVWNQITWTFPVPPALNFMAFVSEKTFLKIIWIKTYCNKFSLVSNFQYQITKSRCRRQIWNMIQILQLEVSKKEGSLLRASFLPGLWKVKCNQAGVQFVCTAFQAVPEACTVPTLCTWRSSFEFQYSLVKHRIKQVHWICRHWELENWYY